MAAPKNLAHGVLVLSRAGARRGGWVWGALLVAAALAGAAASHAYWNQRLAPLQKQSSALTDMQQLQPRLEQSVLQLRMSEARSQELERQVDALNQKLRECQEEATFFRKSRDGKH